MDELECPWKNAELVLFQDAYLTKTISFILQINLKYTEKFLKTVYNSENN